MAGPRGPAWRRYLGEFLVIVVGVLAALWVEEWRDYRTDRDLETLYLNRLLSDVQRDSAGFVSLLGHVDRTRHSSELLHSLVVARESVPTDTLAFLVALEEARSIQNNPWATGTYAELIATGNVRVIRSAALRAALAEYYLRLDELYTWVERRVDRGFRDEATSILPSAFRQGVFDRHWENPEAPSDEWIAAEAVRIDVSPVLARLREIPKVEILLSRVVDRSHGHRWFLESAETVNADLAEMIRRELGTSQDAV